MLVIVPTPIGNLKDITLRALETLKQVDGIICEDSRHSSILLNHYQIKKPLIVLNDYNEAATFPKIISQLRAGQNLALISDAGTPLVADPGFKLVRACLEENIPVDSLPGATAITTSLTLSGLPPSKFCFLYYLPEKEKACQTLLENIKRIDQIMALTYIAFISPHKMTKTLKVFLQTLGDINIVLAAELTKIHQNVEKKKVSEWITQFEKQKPKGEYVLLFNIAY